MVNSWILRVLLRSLSCTESLDFEQAAGIVTVHSPGRVDRDATDLAVKALDLILSL